MPDPLVSVLTPSFNQGRWIASNLASVQAQTYPHIEHVVMDGGSVDGTLDILKADGTPNLRWTSEPDRGQADAINKAFACSSGEIIGWLNSDDAYFARDAVEQAVKVFSERPEVGVVYGHALLVNADGLPLQVLWAPPFSRALLRAYNFICQPTAFVRRSAIGRANLVDIGYDFTMDRELWLHLRRRTGFQRVDRILAVDRHHLARKSLTRADLWAHDLQLLQQQYGLPGFARSALFLRPTKVALRFAGLTKIGEAVTSVPALDLMPVSRGSLAARQVAQLRAWMPPGQLGT